MTFALISLIVFAILVFLKFCEDSPVRSWRMVVIAGVFLSLTISYYFNHAFPKPAPRQSPAERIAVNRAELQRDFRHMAGVKAVRIDDRRIEFDLAGNQPANELKSFVHDAGSGGICQRVAVASVDTDQNNHWVGFIGLQKKCGGSGSLQGETF